MDGQSPGVTIIVDSYNHQHFVGSAINSALAQDHEPLQVIVIDDGSPDRSPEVIKNFGDRIVTIFQENQGQVAACRHALDHALYDIIIFLDSDDLLAPHAARTVAAAWREGISKVQYCLRVIDEYGHYNGNVFPKFSAKLTPETVRYEIFRTGSYPDSPTSGNAYSRSFLQHAMPLLPRRDGIDGELNGIAPLYGDVISLSQPLGSYRIHGGNVFAQRRLNINKFGDYIRHSEARLDFVRDHYQSLGKTIDDDVLDRDVKYQEYALVVAKLGKHLVGTSKNLLGVARTAILAAMRSPHTFVQRAYRIIWIVGVTISPKMFAEALVVQRFIPRRRLDWITQLVTTTSKSSKQSENPPSRPKATGSPKPSSSHI